MTERPPAFHTLTAFLEDRSDYPDDSFRSVKMGMLRDLREQILYLEARVVRKKSFPQSRPQEDALVSLAKHALDLIAQKGSK